MSSSRQHLVAIIHFFNHKSWSPATSTNYSFRNSAPNSNSYTISKSGVDKQYFTEHDFLEIDAQGTPLPSYCTVKPSAETGIHTMLYAQYADCEAILHTHSLLSTVLSAKYLQEGGIYLRDLEVLKAIRGILTHEAEVFVPIFQNSQDIAALSQDIKVYLDQNPNTFGFLLAGHGLYAWGNSLAEAKRHIEAFEFLFQCFEKLTPATH